uniref:trafficking kinesin-binding protein 1-like isoform X2 n=1 Tax=Myxine glutinosa TaxID=7769 RepID=UPI00358F32A4
MRDGPSPKEVDASRVYTDTGTITDVCSAADLPEVEILSLIEERLPQYTLRADSVYSYRHTDWLQTPALSSDSGSDLSPEQAEETLKYMILCAERAGQMNRTYNDIEAVYHLLEEERDLELAARIGQTLLDKNRRLEERVENQDEELEHSVEQVNQLKHELSMKDDLLQFYTSTVDDSETDSNSSTPLERSGAIPVNLHQVNLDNIYRRIKDLEEENVNLQSTACLLKTETIDFEEKEHQLVSNCVSELRETNQQLVQLAEELSHRTEDNARQQEEITQLLSRIVDLQRRNKTFALENEELTQHLGAAKEAQRSLTTELQDLEERYTECLEMMREAQEEMKQLRGKTVCTTPRRFYSSGIFPMDSLAAEIEGSMRREMNIDEDDFSEHRCQQKRVFDTVKCAKEVSRNRSQSLFLPRISGHSLPGSNIQEDSSIPPKKQDNSGSRDLALTLHKLLLRRQAVLSERLYLETERDRRLSKLAVDDKACGDGTSTPTESIMSVGTTVTNVSFRSFLPDKLQIVKPLEGSQTLLQWQQLAQPHLGGILHPRPGVVTREDPVPDELNPLPYTLLDIEEDDTPALSPLIQESCSYSPNDSVLSPPAFSSTPPSYCMTPLPSSTPQMHLSHLPPLFTQDYIPAHNPGKCLSQTSSTFTITTCHILHPTDGLTALTPSKMSTPVPTCSFFSEQSHVQRDSQATWRSTNLAESSTRQRDSTTMLSSSLGLARLLKERGISAAVYAPPRLPSRQHCHPTLSVTPPNSPQHSPCSSPPPFHRPHRPSGLPLNTFLASKPAQSILREVRANQQQNSTSSTSCQTDLSSSLGLVERLRRLGLIGEVRLPSRASRSSEACGGDNSNFQSSAMSLHDDHSQPAMLKRTWPAATDTQPQVTEDSVGNTNPVV